MPCESHQPPTAEPAISPDRDFHFRPSRAELIGQEFQHGAGVLGGVDVAGPQVSGEQFAAAEDV